MALRAVEIWIPVYFISCLKTTTIWRCCRGTVSHVSGHFHQMCYFVKGQMDSSEGTVTVPVLVILFAHGKFNLVIIWDIVIYYNY